MISNEMESPSSTITNDKLKNDETNIPSHSEPIDYEFTKEFRIPKPNSYRGIFVPCYDIEPFEVYLSKEAKTLEEQLSKLLGTPKTRKEYIGKGDSSFFYFSLFTILDPLDSNGSTPPEGSIKYQRLESLPLNDRANLLKKKKKLKGDAIFINIGLDRIERDITIEQYKKLINNLIPKQKVFDFENNLISNQDIVGLILYKSNFNFNLNEEEQILKKKNPTAIINEYKAIISSDEINVITETFGGFSKPFYSTCRINDHIIYSKIFPNKTDSIRSCHFRALRYLNTLQSVRLGHWKEDDKVVEEILNENYYTDEIDQFIKTILQHDLNYNKNKEKEKEESIMKEYEKNLDLLQKVSLELDEDVVDGFENDKSTQLLYGVRIKSNHSAMGLRDGKIVIHWIKEVDPSVNSPTVGDEVNLDFIYYLSNGKVFDKKKEAFTFGNDDSIINGLHLVISKMRYGEIVLAEISADYAYGEYGIRSHGSYVVPPNETLGVLVELTQSKRNKPTPLQLAMMPMNKRIKAIKKFNEQAKEAFKVNLYLKAYRFYRISKSYCNKKYLGKSESDEEFQEFQELAAQTYTNIVICYEKMPTNKDMVIDRVLKYCNASLDFCETSKAYRIRSAYFKNLEEYEQSLNDLIAAKEIDEINKSFNPLTIDEYNEKIDNLKQLLDNYKKKEQNVYINHFEKQQIYKDNNNDKKEEEEIKKNQLINQEENQKDKEIINDQENNDDDDDQEENDEEKEFVSLNDDGFILVDKKTKNKIKQEIIKEKVEGEDEEFAIDKLTVGKIVDAQYTGDDLWYKGKIEKINGDGTYLISYPNYNNECEVLPFERLKQYFDYYDDSDYDSDYEEIDNEESDNEDGKNDQVEYVVENVEENILTNNCSNKQKATITEEV